MQDSAKAILNIFKNLGYEAWYAGTKCRNDLYNEMHKQHLKCWQTTIYTNARLDIICKLFQQHTKISDVKVVIEFANEKIAIETYHKVKYNCENEHFDRNCEYILVDTLDEHFEKEVFTINCVAKTEEQNYYFANARMDMTNKIIKTIRNSKDVFIEYPLRTLQAFALMSETGFKIDKAVLKDIKSTMRYLRFIDADLVCQQLRKIITGKNATETLKLMHKLSLFNSKCMVDEEKEKILVTFDNYKENRFDVLDSFKKSNEIELELWAVIFDDSETMQNELKKFNCFSDLELYSIKFLMDNKNICNQPTNKDYRHAIYNSITDEIRNEGIHFLKNLMLKSAHLYKMINNGVDKELKKTQSKNLLFNLCARPYFTNQLDYKVNDEIKQKIIEKYLDIDKLPLEKEDMLKGVLNEKIEN